MTRLLLLAWTFLKTGAFALGGGYAMIPTLHHEVVEVLRWVSPREFLDAVAVAHLTPGPAAIIATMIGYRVAGAGGAVTVTASLFAPRAYGRMRHAPVRQAMTSALKPTVLGLLLAVVRRADPVYLIIGAWLAGVALR